MTVRAIYENGVFKPAEPVNLPEKAQVELESRLLRTDEGFDSHDQSTSGQVKVLEILSRRYRTGQTDAAARHDEHQP